jgi:hypothetical protein
MLAPQNSKREMYTTPSSLPAGFFSLISEDNQDLTLLILQNSNSKARSKVQTIGAVSLLAGTFECSESLLLARRTTLSGAADTFLYFTFNLQNSSLLECSSRAFFQSIKGGTDVKLLVLVQPSRLNEEVCCHECDTENVLTLPAVLRFAVLGMRVLRRRIQRRMAHVQQASSMLWSSEAGWRPLSTSSLLASKLGGYCLSPSLLPHSFPGITWGYLLPPGCSFIHVPLLSNNQPTQK